MSKNFAKVMVLIIIMTIITGCTRVTVSTNVKQTTVEEKETVKPKKKEDESKNDDEYPLKIKNKYELADGSTLLYKSDELGGKSEISVQLSEGEAVICDKKPSVPAVSPYRKKVAYIDMVLWETIGDVYLYDVIQRTNKVIIKKEIDFDHEYTPSKLAWLDDNNLLVIIKYAYGTRTVGGDLYLHNVNDEEFLLTIKPEGYDQISDIIVEGDKVTIEYTKFQNGSQLSSYTEVYNRDEILDMSNNNR
ncbi:DUF4652 domain-containing protein [Sporosalibacterium faouarense]|uniref:DUF4652 domain-containing protein n=1 Tax=Sporosalibacterium faouarense TaxID=516123 RepID=UPI00141C5B6C|nr:DUF4652 domain-containing protein [Sporosalibacterium faouarense]MTI47941.1 DUF4652 domain-containing protein [Bacillota bacterium]